MSTVLASPATKHQAQSLTEFYRLIGTSISQPIYFLLHFFFFFPSPSLNSIHRSSICFNSSFEMLSAAIDPSIMRETRI